MDTNKEEALRCLRIAKNQYGTKNYEAAVRLTKKAISLFPTDEAKEFLLKAQKAASESPSSTASTAEVPKADTAKSSASEKPNSYQQSQEVKEILACGTDYYKVLKLSKDCTEIEIKKSYKKVIIPMRPHMSLYLSRNSLH